METEKLYSPLSFYLRDKEDAENGVYDGINYWRDELSHEEAFGYIDQIEAFLARDRRTYDTERGLAEYLRSDSLNEKVRSLIPQIELHGDKLWIVAHLRLKEPLSSPELLELKDWWEGQLSDGVGESWEQRKIKVDRGELYLEPWTSDDHFFIDTQREFSKRLGLETPAQAALHEPDIYDDNATAALREELIHRLDDNFTAYLDSLRNQDTETLAGTSSEIAAMAGAHYYLSEIHNFHTSELEYLLQFQNPLQVVGDAFQISGMDDYSDVMWDIFDRQDAIQGDYPLMKDAAVEGKTRQESKRSVLDQLRDATKLPKEPHKDKPSRDNSGPER